MQLFDHLVGAGEQRRRHDKIEHPYGLQVDDKLEPSRLQHRQIGRLGALEDATRIDADVAIRVRQRSPLRSNAGLTPNHGCARRAHHSTLTAPDLLLAGALCWCASPGALEGRRHAMPHIRLIRDR